MPLPRSRKHDYAFSHCPWPPCQNCISSSRVYLHYPCPRVSIYGTNRRPSLTSDQLSCRPTSQSSFYVGPSNGSLAASPIVTGKVFDRFIQIWLENTDYAQAASQPAFTNLSTQGITLTGYYGVTHPSEPNYLAAAGGDFWGLAADSLEYIPSNMSTIVDLLDQKNVSWASYQENMPTDGYTGYNYTNAADGYTYYVRKHNPLIIYNSVANISSRTARIRNFNDFAVDVRAHFFHSFSQAYLVTGW